MIDVMLLATEAASKDVLVILAKNIVPLAAVIFGSSLLHYCLKRRHDVQDRKRRELSRQAEQLLSAADSIVKNAQYAIEIIDGTSEPGRGVQRSWRDLLFYESVESFLLEWERTLLPEHVKNNEAIIEEYRDSAAYLHQSAQTWREVASINHSLKAPNRGQEIEIESRFRECRTQYEKAFNSLVDSNKALHAKYRPLICLSE